MCGSHFSIFFSKASHLEWKRSGKLQQIHCPIKFWSNLESLYTIFLSRWSDCPETSQLDWNQCFQLAVALLEAYMLPTLCELTVGMHSDAKTTAKALVTPKISSSLTPALIQTLPCYPLPFGVD